jgi:hypothetical protein
MSKLCIECEKEPRIKGRRYCKACYLNRRKEKYRLNGGNSSKKRYGTGNCNKCGKDIKLNSKDQKWCLKCFREISSFGSSHATNNYENAKGGGYCWMHRRIAEEVLGRKLKTNEVVHHVDLDVNNNSIKNLMVISRRMHGKLQAYIRAQGALLEKSGSEQNENCWNTLIAPMTTTWLETAGVKVIKLWEIGQSAAEPLNQQV